MIGFMRFNTWLQIRNLKFTRAAYNFFSNDKVNVHIQLTEQIQHDEWEFRVERPVDYRRTDWQLQLKIKWLGLQEETWETFDPTTAHGRLWCSNR
jgi:hypothetical protein